MLIYKMTYMYLQLEGSMGMCLEAAFAQQVHCCYWTVCLLVRGKDREEGNQALSPVLGACTASSPVA